MDIPGDLVLVGYVSGAFGIQGWVRVRPYSSDADALLHAKTWWLSAPDGAGELRDVEMMQAKSHGEDVVARRVGVAYLGAAEALQDKTEQNQHSQFPPL